MDYEALAISLVKRYGYSGKYGYAYSVEAVTDKMVMAHRLYNPEIGTLEGFLIDCGRKHLRRIIRDNFDKPHMFSFDAKPNSNRCYRKSDRPNEQKRRKYDFTHLVAKTPDSMQPVHIAIRQEAINYITNKEVFGETAEYVLMLINGNSYEEIAKKFNVCRETICNRVQKAISAAKRHFS